MNNIYMSIYMNDMNKNDKLHFYAFFYTFKYGTFPLYHILFYFYFLLSATKSAGENEHDDNHYYCSD